MLADKEIQDAAEFLDPVLNPTGSRPNETAGPISLAQALLAKRGQAQASGEDASTVASEHAVGLLRAICSEILRPTSTNDEIEVILQTSDSRRVIDSLLDVISVEGIYPYFVPGVGVPIQNRMRSSLKKYSISIERSTSEFPRDTKISNTIDLLLACTRDRFLSAVVFERIVVDLLAILLQYSSSPENNDASMRNELGELIQRMPLRYLYPSLTMLLHPAAPVWIKVVVSTTLAGLPMRELGIRETLLFLATAQASSSSHSDQAGDSSGPLLTHELLERLAKVVCSIPTSVTADDWFRNMAAQLFAYLDSDDLDDQKIGSYAAGAVLSRRQIGSPGTSGWRYLAEPILSQLACETFEISPKTKVKPEPTSESLMQAMDRLARLVTLNLNPGLLKRLCSRVVPAIWVLACGPLNQPSLGMEAAVKTLKAYLHESGQQAILKLLENIDRDGPRSCQITWTKGERWLAAPVLRAETIDSQTDVFGMMGKLSSRVDILVDMIQDMDSTVLGQLCVDVVRRWLSSQTRQTASDALSEHQDGHPHISFVYLKFLQSLLEKCQEKLVSSPQHFVPLVIEMIAAFLKDHKPQADNVVGLESLAGITRREDTSSAVSEDSMSMVGIALGLLSMLLVDEQQFVSATPRHICLSLKAVLEKFSERNDLPAEITLPARQLLDQLYEAVGVKSAVLRNASRKGIESHDDASLHRVALDKIAAPEPYIRAEGLTELNGLIKRSSSVILISSTVVVLLALLKEDDEYTHIAALRSLVVLGAHRPSATIFQLTSYFVDANEESSLDLRLKLAESIQQIVADIGPRLDATTLARALDSAILVSGRRPERVKEADRRAKEARQQERKARAAARPGTISFPNLTDDDGDQVAPADEAAAKLLAEWAGSGREEDIRVRTSALSIVNTVLEHGFSLLQQSSIDDIFGLVVSILRLEQGESEALLRRSAILCLGTLVGQAESSSSLQAASLSLNTALLEDAMACLADAVIDEQDEIARGHAMAVKSAIEESRTNALERHILGQDIRFDLGGQLRGLAVNPETLDRPKPEIQEIE